VSLKEALGIVTWKPLVTSLVSQGVVSTPFLSHEHVDDIYCIGEELPECWNNESDDRWRLLLNIASALQVSHDRLVYVDWDDVPSSANRWYFGEQLPLLGEMLLDPLQKRHAWQYFMSGHHVA